MAIAKLKKLTLLAEQDNQDLVLKSVQKMQNVEIVPLPSLLEEELLEGLDVKSNKDELSDIEQKLNDLEYALKFTDQYVPQPGLIESLRTKREVFTMDELESSVDEKEVLAALQLVSDKEQALNKIEEKKNKLREEELFFRRWKKLDHLPEEWNDFQLMGVDIGSLEIEYASQFKESLDELQEVYYEEIFRDEDSIGFYVIYPSEHKKTIQSTLSQTGFQALNYKYDRLPKEELKANLKEREHLIEQSRDIKEELKSYKDKQHQLQLAEEYYYNKAERQKAKELILNSDRLFIVSGWIDQEELDDVQSSLTSSLDDQIAILTEDIKVEEYDDTPTKLSNHSLFEPFELLLEMFSFPKYGELDPTKWIAPFFFIFFGMMSADAGYGLVVSVGIFVALKLFEFDKSTKKSLKFFGINSISTIIFGLIFGSFFGVELPFQLLSLQDDVITILIISLILGAIHLFLGLGINAYSNHRNGKHWAAYIESYSWILIIVGAGLLAVGSSMDVPAIIGTAGKVLVFGNLAGIVVASMFAAENPFAGLGQGLYALTDISGYAGDIVSYSRLMALGVASANIGMAFNLLISYLPPVFRFTLGVLLFLALHFINIFIAFLGAYVHSLRLHYVEMFGKFYEGGGRAFKPLKTLEKHIWLNDK